MKVWRFREVKLLPKVTQPIKMRYWGSNLACPEHPNGTPLPLINNPQSL